MQRFSEKITLNQKPQARWFTLIASRFRLARRVTIASSPDLAAMAQEMVGEHTGHHGFANRHADVLDALDGPLQ